MNKKTNVSKFRKNILKDSEEAEAGRNNLLESTEILFLDSTVGNAAGDKNYKRLFFGMEAAKATELGYKLTKRGYFEAAESPSAINTARTLKNFLKEIGYSNETIILELFSGTGQTAWAFAKEGFRVRTIEQHVFTHECARQNLILAGVANMVECINDDGVAILNEAIARKANYAAVYLDPPWNGNYKYNLLQPFSLQHTNPPSNELIEQAIKIAPIVVFKAPQTIDIREIRTIGKILCCKTIIHYQNIQNFKQELNQATVYFIKNKVGFEIEFISL